VKVLRIIDGEKPPMGYIYEGMDRAKEAIRTLYGEDEANYCPLMEIIHQHSPFTIPSSESLSNPNIFYNDKSNSKRS
jgi:hypothetical protein